MKFYTVFFFVKNCVGLPDFFKKKFTEYPD